MSYDVLIKNVTKLSLWNQYAIAGAGAGVAVAGQTVRQCLCVRVRERKKERHLTIYQGRHCTYVGTVRTYICVYVRVQ